MHLTVEPVTFGSGLPVFTGQAGPAEAVLASLGFATRDARELNAAGTRYLVLEQGDP